MSNHFGVEACSNFDSDQTAVLVDGSGFIFRAFYAIPHLSTATGFPTNALFGYSRMLLKLIKELNPAFCAVVFDAGRENFRHQLFAEYKANRAAMPDALRPQIPFFARLTEALGLPTFSQEGYEADDLIGTFAKYVRCSGGSTIVVTGDKDLAQLVNSQTVIFDPMKDIWFDAAAIKKKYGVAPEQFIDYLALVGDSSDNIPGLKGVGPKGAVALLEHFGGIAKLLERPEEVESIKGLRGKSQIVAELVKQAKLVQVSYQLAKINCDVPLVSCSDCEFNWQDLFRRQDPDQAAISQLARQLEFSELFGTFNGDSQNNPERADVERFEVVIVRKDGFDQFVEKLRSIDEFSFDLETTSLDITKAELVGASFCFDSDSSYYVPLAHLDGQGGVLADQVAIDLFVNQMRDILENPKIGKVGQNLKYDCAVLLNYGISLDGIVFDSMLAAYLIDPDSGNFNLENLASVYLDYQCSAYSKVTEGLADFAHVAIADAADYAAEDAYIAWRLYEVLEPALKDAQLESVLTALELPLVPLLARMELKGIALDAEVLRAASSEWGVQMLALEQQICSEAGQQFNVNSPKQLAEVIFEKMGVPTKGVKRTKTGFSTDSSVLEKLAPHYHIAQLVLQYRLFNKLRTTYGETLPQQVSALGRVHSSFRQTGTATGRLSSSNPNLQNIPIATPEGRRIRGAFIASAGCSFVAADYSQIELRLLAHLSQDELLISAFRNGIDIHEQTAREILGLNAAASVSKEQRRFGKTINFGIIYGMGAYRLGMELGIPLYAARDYIDKYFERYPKVSAFFDSCKDLAAREGEVRTLLGRRRIIREEMRNSRDKGFLERVAMNAPLQGSAADIIKLAMIKVAQALSGTVVRADLVLQIHDELVYEVANEDVSIFKEMLEVKMSTVVDLLVPLEVDIRIGHNWESVS